MSVPKTKPTEVSAESYIAAIANEEQRNDAQRLVVLMRKVTRDDLLAKLGEHKTGKVCVYIRRLANVDMKVPERLVACRGDCRARNNTCSA